jgi:hypothetical protein
MEFLGLRDRKYFREYILNPMIEKGYIKRTVMEKPRSGLQRYVTTKIEERAAKT